MSVALASVGAKRRALAYLELTKPRIGLLVTVTAVPALLLAAGGFPDPVLFWGTLAGTVFAAGSAASFNHFVDRDIDAMMRRTAMRPLPSGVLPPHHALVVGFVLAGLAWVTLVQCANALAAGIAMASIVYYAVIYSIWLKRRTPQNIVWGGLAGCFPTLIGWTAITGRLGWEPVVLFLVVFFWTPPHFWALAMRYRDDYVAANVPMLPVVAGEAEVAKQIVRYSLVMVATSLLLWPVAQTGLLYPVAAAVLGGAFMVEAYRLRGRIRAGATGPAARPMRLFHWSNTYLTLLFLAVAVDTLLR